MATDGTRKNMDGGKALAVRQALSATSGGRTASVGSGTTRSATQPETWVASDLAYPDLSLLRGTSTLFGTAIQNPGDSTSAGSSVSPGVYNVPYIKEEFIDYMSWMFTEDSSTLPEEYGACPSDATINVTGAGTTYPDLTDTMADMRLSIFDGDMATEYSYTPSGGGTNTVETVNGRWAAGDMSTIGMQKQVTVLYSGYGVYKDYATSVPGQTAADIFPSGDKAVWYDPDKKARAVAMINRSTDNFLQTTIGTVTVTGSTTPVTGTEETYTVTFDGNAPDATYTWSTSPATSTIDVNTGTNTAGITFDADDTYTVTVTVTSDSSSDSPVDGNLASVVSSSSGDWPDTETGVGSYPEFNSTSQSITYFTNYPAGNTYNCNTIRFSGPGTYGKYPETDFTTPQNARDSSEYMDVWVPTQAARTAFNENQKSGWYVFQKDDYSAATSNVRIAYSTAIAWPTVVDNAGDGRNQDGYLSLGVNPEHGGTYAIKFATLPPGASGQGGTDSWSDPPQASGIGTLIVDNGTTGSGLGSTDGPVQEDANTLFPDGQSALGSYMSFRDAAKDGTWTQDGFGLFWPTAVALSRLSGMPALAPALVRLLSSKPELKQSSGLTTITEPLPFGQELPGTIQLERAPLM